MSPFGQSELRSRESGSTVKGIKQSELKKILLPIPPFQEQLDMAKILHNIDEKIRNNKCMNATLEKIAQRIFKSWFVDFDPVKANAESISFDGLSPEIQALFPNEFEESELGMIPKGWETLKLSDAVKLVGGGTPKRSIPTYWNGDINWFSVKDVPSKGEVFVIDTKEKITQLGIDKSSTKTLRSGTTIITARGTVGKLALVADETCMNQSCYGVQGKNIGDYFTYFTLKDAIFALQKNAHGAVFDTITKQTFESILVVKAPDEISQKFEEITSSLLNKIKNNGKQSIYLRKIRDKLLPRLISGKITIQKAEELLEAAS
jgi:type I restriction enzyme S subunit